MKYITLGNSKVPAIGLGTYRITGSGAIDIIIQAIESGYRHLDTAQLYDNENEIGQAIRESGIPRSEIFLTTKIWPSNLTEALFLTSVNESLSKLKTDYADLLLIHWPHEHLPVKEYMYRLIEAQKMGLAKNIGVSNFNITQLKEALSTGAGIVTNQVEFHPWINQTKLHSYMTAQQIPLTAYRPLGKTKLLTYKKVDEVAEKYGRSAPQIILRWMMQKEDIIAIPKSSNQLRQKENLNVFDFQLSDEEMEMIDAWKLENIRLVDAQAGAKWD